jgi:quinol monooxygenase YgiN
MMARPSRSWEAIEALRHISFASRMDRGFIEDRIYRDVDNPDALWFLQTWSSELELKSHIRSSCFTNLLLLMETSPEAPLLEIFSITNVSGMKYIEKIRSFDD